MPSGSGSLVLTPPHIPKLPRYAGSMHVRGFTFVQTCQSFVWKARSQRERSYEKLDSERFSILLRDLRTRMRLNDLLTSLVLRQRRRRSGSLRWWAISTLSMNCRAEFSQL